MLKTNFLGACDDLRGDREIVMEAVSQDGEALHCASEELRGDREIVMKAVSGSGKALWRASEELRGDREIVMQAVSQTGWALAFASNELRGDVSLIELALARGRPEERLIFLKVALLSGRTYNQIFDIACQNVEDHL